MSVRVSAIVWDRFPEGGGKLILMQALADIGDDHGQGIWAGYAFLAAKCRMSERQLRRLIETLISDGWLIEPEPGIPGRKIARDRYHIDIEKLSKCPPLLHQKRRTSATKKPDISDKKPDTISPESKRASQIDPEPYNRINQVTTLKSYLATLKKTGLSSPEEIERVETEIRQLENV